MAIKRVFIEIDVCDRSHVSNVLEAFLNIPNIESFDYIYDNIGIQRNIPEIQNAIKECDEIYCDTSLIPQYTNLSSPDLMNRLMHWAVEEKITNKKLIFLRPIARIQWHYLKETLLRSVCENNQIFAFSDDYENLVQLDEVFLNQINF